MNEFRLYWRYTRMHLLTFFQYKGWPLLLLPNLLFVVLDPLDVALLINRFGGIGERSAARIFLMYGMALTAFGLAELFGRGFDYFPMLIRNGEFDWNSLRTR